MLSLGGPKRAHNKSKVADGRHFEKKSKNCHISAKLWPISTKFGKMPQSDLLNMRRSKRFELIRNHWMATILKAGKSQCLGNGLTDRHKIWCDNTYWPSATYQLLITQTFKNPTWWTAATWKSKNRNIFVTVWPIAAKFVMITHIDPLTPMAFKIVNF